MASEVALLTLEVRSAMKTPTNEALDSHSTTGPYPRPGSWHFGIERLTPVPLGISWAA